MGLARMNCCLGVTPSVLFDSWWESDEHQASPHVVDYMVQLRDRLEEALEYAHKKQEEV